VCSFQTFFSPDDIFAITQLVEIQLGKVPKPKNASRPIDIDFLFYGDCNCQGRELKIPHPCWKERLFVLVPLADLMQEVILQGTAGPEHYSLPALIQPLLAESPQAIYLLEKNLDLQ
jgi:2-amino-4-hydroxy-6-hydroxymethyldihydropteridine diphosphokinase